MKERKINQWELFETNKGENRTKHYEGLFTQGSGYLHIRGSYEEGLLAEDQNEEYMRLPANVTVEEQKHTRSKFGTYVPGITGVHPLLKEELVNLPNPLKFVVIVDGEYLDMDESKIEQYTRNLNMENGILTRSFLWSTKQGGVLQCKYERYVSRKRTNLIVQQVSFTLLEGTSTLTLLSDIDEKVKTNGYNHFSQLGKEVNENQVDVMVETDNKDKIFLSSVAISQQVTFEAVNNQCIGSIKLSKGDSVVVDKLSCVNTSRDRNNYEAGMDTLHKQLNDAIKNLEHLITENNQSWKEMWNQSHIEIMGDEEAQRAVNFSIYHLMRCANKNESRIAICAKGFSGEAYFGHFFWDTEIYMLPFYLYTAPKVACNLTSFRINTLEGAKKNGKAYGYPGAKYPWESSVSGEEQCPNWQYADHEIHITADVVIGLWHYYKATNQKEFIVKAAPVFIETAKYWVSRVDKKKNGSVNLNGVMGPDEYICFSNNNAYTNFVVKYSLQLTLEVIKILEAEDVTLLNKLDVSEKFKDEINNIKDNLQVKQKPNGVILQCDDFEDYEEPDFDKVWKDRTKKFGSVISQERNYRIKALKQADVLMLPYLFPNHFTKEQVKANYDYYIPYTTHDSSLSYIIHSIICNRIDEKEQAYQYFKQALNIDLDEKYGDAAEGIHIANCGGIWQAVIFGFAGMKFSYESNQLEFDPKLPKHWDTLKFKIMYQGERYIISIKEKHVSIERDDKDEGE